MAGTTQRAGETEVTILARLTLGGDGHLADEYAAGARSDDKEWTEAKVPSEPFPSIFRKDLIARIQQAELALLSEVAKKPPRQFRRNGDGSIYRRFLRAEVF